MSIILVVLGFFAGLLGALTGIGGGVLLSPLLVLYFGIPLRQAIGTSLVAVITTSAASSSIHLQRHTTDVRLGMTLELFTSFGAAVTAYLESHIDGEDEKNALARPVPVPEVPNDWIRMWAVFLGNRVRWSQHAALNGWLMQSRIDSIAVNPLPRTSMATSSAG